MKQKPQKIKRYSPFEDRRATRRKRFILRAAATVAGLAVLFGAGWWIAKSGIDWLGGPGDELPEVIIPEAVSIPDASVPADDDPDMAEIDGGEFPTAPVSAGGNWAALAHEEIASVDFEDTLARLADSGVSHVLVTLKDSGGAIYYPSGESAAAGSIADAGFDAAAVASAITNAGMTPAAGISAFEDSLAPYAQRDMAIQLASGSNYLWLNGSPSSGGVPWLNPYSEKARGFIEAILDEVLALGYREIVVEGMTFPSGFGLEQANLAATGTVIGVEEQLSATAQSWQQRVADAGGQCWFSYSAATLLGEESQLTGVSPLQFGIQCVIATGVSGDEQAAQLVANAENNGVQVVALQGVPGFTGGSEGATGVSLFVN